MLPATALTTTLNLNFREISTNNNTLIHACTVYTELSEHTTNPRWIPQKSRELLLKLLINQKGLNFVLFLSHKNLSPSKISTTLSPFLLLRESTLRDTCHFFPHVSSYIFMNTVCCLIAYHYFSF